MAIQFKSSELLTVNLYKKIEYIFVRIKKINMTLSSTNNLLLKKRLIKESRELQILFIRIHKIIHQLNKTNNSDFSLTALLLQFCNNIKSENFENKELFFY